MLYTIAILVSGVYIGQEYAILPSVRILIANLLIYLKNLREPIEDAGAQVVQNPTIYEKMVKIFWW
jgi:hypothetical protein